MTENFVIGNWYLETNRRGHYLAFNSSQGQAERLVFAIDETRLGVRAWGESFRPARDGVSYDWYVLLKSRRSRDECLSVLNQLLAERNRQSEDNDFVPEHIDSDDSKNFWQRLVSVLPWVHEPESRSPGEGPESRGVFTEADDDLNRRPIYELVVSLDTSSWQTSGVLSKLGYKVGRSGLNASARRQILRNALTVALIAQSSEIESYVREWGAPNSSQRGDKIERCLSGFANTARRRSADMSDAIADWEADLEWFRTQRGR